MPDGVKGLHTALHVDILALTPYRYELQLLIVCATLHTLAASSRFPKETHIIVINSNALIRILLIVCIFSSPFVPNPQNLGRREKTGIVPTSFLPPITFFMISCNH
jgi:hypothetical protein